MTQKHLVRHKLVGLTEEHEYDRIVQANRALVDEFLSDYFSVHTIDITPDEMQENKVGVYERDNMNEIGDFLVVTPGIANENLAELLSNIEYEKKVAVSQELLSDGGKYVMGENFGLVSKIIDFNNEMQQSLGTGVPIYRVYNVSTIFLPGVYHDYGGKRIVDKDTNWHIDCRFNIVDQAHVIYVAMGARPGTMKEGPNPLKEESFETLQKAAKEHGYEIRDFLIEEDKIDEKIRDPEVLSAGEKFGPDWVGGHAINGINFITKDNYLFTSIIGHGEREYLENKGINVVEVPLKFTYNGAGLRCVYGELTTNSHQNYSSSLFK